MKATGQQVRAARELLGLSQGVLGKRIGTTQHTVSRIESEALIHLKWIPKLDAVFGGSQWRLQAPLGGTPSVVADRKDDIEAMREEIRFVANQVEHLRGLVQNLLNPRGALPRAGGKSGEK